MSYSSGIFSSCPANAYQFVNHAVLLIGFDINGNWIIKNSWGPEWGENGFATISVSNDCGLIKYVYSLKITNPLTYVPPVVAVDPVIPDNPVVPADN
jgi:C1A family cysteine protease